MTSAVLNACICADEYHLGLTIWSACRIHVDNHDAYHRFPTIDSANRDPLSS